ncbi:hypothetical protein WG66_011499 [Moniliophthora roreri]|uniref:Cleavage/polyadenylation specificity factor A subunit N-terminal domain-containing protein n=1 Tax=Moniliophthora roreri TaxID=221103 RepID=A0A0W0FQ89_MONRR|nr:hypothetical protein WG66_011499 [Moniliophthora roreri]
MKHIKTDLRAEQIHLSYPYLFTFSEEATNIYEIRSSSPHHIATLSQNIEGYFREGSIIIDPSRDALIVVCNSVMVFNLHDGQLQKNLGLFGTLTDTPIRYDRGRVLVTLSDDEEQDGEEKEYFWILSCNPFDLELPGYSFLTQIQRASAEKNMLYSHVLPSREGGVVVAQHTSYTDQPMKLHYWSPEGQPYDESLPPAYTVDIPMTLEDGSSIEARDAVPIDETTFALCTVEMVLDCLDSPGSHQSVIRVVSLPALDTLWSSDPIVGEAKHIYHVPGEDIVLIIGVVSEREDPKGDSADYATWIAAFDTQSGERRQFTKLNHRKIGKRLVGCRLTATVTEKGDIVPSDEPDIVFLTSIGDVATFSLSKFLTEGLPSDDFAPLEKSSLSSGLQLKDIGRRTLDRRVCISQGSTAVVDDESLISIFTW